jgi:acetyltransferase-like isoleucine patch superfamily enzyme
MLDRLKRAVRPRLRSLLQRILWEQEVDTGWIDPARITMGRHSYHMPRIVLHGDQTSTAHVTIGSFCSIARGVRILLDGNHRHDFITTSPLPQLGETYPDDRFSKGPVVVGHDVWIGQWASILSGVTIGSGAVIGAGSVVTKDVRPYAIVVGNPAQEVRRRFSDSEIEELLATEWWSWPDERIRAAQPLLWSSDVRGFVEFARSDERQ